VEREPFTVFLDLPDREAPPLSLKRAPVFLRFVVKGNDWKTFDALDQLTDEPAAGERVIVGERKGRSVVYMDGTRGRRRVGWREVWWNYDPVPDQPPAEVTADTGRWRAWCVEQMTKRKAVSNSAELSGTTSGHTAHQERTA
jgi:hypothetical protein